MNGGKIMDKPLVTIEYKTADGKRIRLEVSIEVKELLEQSDRQTRSQRRQDRRHIDYVDFMDGFADAAMIDPQADIASLFCRMESYKRIYTSLDQLSVIQRRRLRLYFICDLTYRQIAELEGVSQTAIEQSVKSALIKVRKLLDE
jgi:RNA polymerase sigma factor (sigma-70 family)